MTISLDQPLTLSALREVYESPVTLALTDAARGRIDSGARIIAKIVDSGSVVYGVNTGFGLLASKVVGRDHLDAGSVASPNRETEAMRDGSDAVSDWPLLNGLLNTASGATWVSLHHGGGVGMGYSQHAGVVIVADGTDEAREKLERVLWNDPATGVMRHADAGYAVALETAREKHLNLPSLGDG